MRGLRVPALAPDAPRAARATTAPAAPTLAVAPGAVWVTAAGAARLPRREVARSVVPGPTANERHPNIATAPNPTATKQSNAQLSRAPNGLLQVPQTKELPQRWPSPRPTQLSWASFNTVSSARHSGHQTSPNWLVRHRFAKRLQKTRTPDNTNHGSAGYGRLRPHYGTNKHCSPAACITPQPQKSA